MKLFGHPLHMILIHFPSALLPMEWVCYFLYFLLDKETFAHSAVFAMVGGVGIGWLAIIVGAIDLLKIDPAKESAMKKALIHGSINTITIIGYSVLALLAFKTYPVLPGASLVLVVVKGILIGIMVVGNYLGGNLILKEKIGIIMPE